jgi:hypothetical protein
MAATAKDPTEAMRVKASRYPGVGEGTACTQSSFKTAKGAFLYVGIQGGRYKAMFKLQQSMPQAAKLAQDNPDAYQVGSTAWVTARFSAEKPMPKRLWEKWLDESYSLSLGTGSSGPPPRNRRRRKLRRRKPRQSGRLWE